MKRNNKEREKKSKHLPSFVIFESSSIFRTFLIEPNVLASLTSTLGYKDNRPVTNTFMQSGAHLHQLTGKGRLDDILSVSGLVPMGDVKSD